MEREQFRGTFTALVTPFRAGPGRQSQLDLATWDALLEWQISVGVAGVVIYGTTGEAPTLSQQEKLELTKRAVEVVAGRVPVIAGTGSNATGPSIELTQTVKRLGVDAVLTVAPYYNKPNQEGLLQHFRAIADEGGLPLVLYNIPGRSVISISLDTIARLSEHPKIVAIKQAVDSAAELTELAGRIEGRMALLAGDDPIIYATMAAGGTGVISASASVIPERICAITDRALQGDWAGAKAAQQEALPFIRALFSETNPAPAKAALQLMGRLPDDSLRLPLVSVADTTRRRLQELFA
ncbi:MAG: 4-hydroxy-tetrahydrodipicolinate synthase [Bdellovibrionales bacterium]|nr:4-hydroxy-tetrahydrodipicolinate synthase [Bdellovibrionales bacterium]